MTLTSTALILMFFCRGKISLKRTRGVAINVLEEDIIFPKFLGYHSQQRKPWDILPIEMVKLGTFLMTSHNLSLLIQSFFLFAKHLEFSVCVSH